MTAPTFHGRNGSFAASALLEAVGDAIGAIKQARGLTYVDVGAGFGKSDDVAASYRSGASDMPLSAFVRGVVNLGDDIGNAALAFAGKKLADIDAICETPDAAKLAPLARAVAMMAEITCPTSAGGTCSTREERLANAQTIRDLARVSKELNDQLDADLLAVGGR